MPVATVAEKIAGWSLGLAFGDLPAPVVHEVKRRVLDTLACCLGAYDSPASVAARAVAPVIGGAPSSHIIGVNEPTTPEDAAFANCVMARYLDWNDTYLSLEPAHPSDNILAALSVAEAEGRDGRSFIAAIVAAYEVQCRLCDAASLRARGFDHVAYGAFASTVAAAMLMGLSRAETVDALGITGVTSAALRQTRSGELSMWKGAAFAHAARNAVFAARLAKAGMTGPAPVFEGEFGFMKQVSGRFELPAFANKTGPGFKILDACMKHYPAEYHAQSAIEAASAICAELKGATGKIESVTVHTFRAAYEIIGSGEERWRPATRETADHSLPFLTATALSHGNVTLASFDDERLHDERLLKLAAKVRISVDEGLDRLYPKAMPNRVEVRLSSGDVITREVIYPVGHPVNPLSDAEVEAKFRRLAAWRLTDGEIDAVIREIWRMDELRDAGEILRPFSRTTKRAGGKDAVPP
ncbi:MAG: MmgE/PrpD family protein [Deltaproteobacteria bacterium]|nr:MmgE/PrpD family protein [Deltaproteobacteria bacterium]